MDFINAPRAAFSAASRGNLRKCRTDPAVLVPRDAAERMHKTQGSRESLDLRGVS